MVRTQARVYVMEEKEALDSNALVQVYIAQWKEKRHMGAAGSTFISEETEKRQSGIHARVWCSRWKGTCTHLAFRRAFLFAQWVDSVAMVGMCIYEYHIRLSVRLY